MSNLNSCYEDRKKAILVLEDGSYFIGHGFGATGKVSGEVVFSTSMVGCSELLTDPSSYGQILTLTYPLIGNCGAPSYDIVELGVPRYLESESIKATGLIIHELCTKPHHWTSSKTLDEWFEEEDVPGMYGIDTRKLTKKLRVEGIMLGILQVYDEGEDINIEKLLKEVRRIPNPNSRDLVKEVTTKEPIFYKSGGDKVVVLIDCGVQYSILRSLIKRRLNVIRVPYNFSAREIMEYNPSGVIISNGPGDPKKCDKTIQCVMGLVEENVPTMGICLGNLILALALGGDTYKMKYGHRSQNQPVLDLKQPNKCYITAQNHGYAVKAESLYGMDIEVLFVNANDKTIEGIKHISKPAFAYQFHPEVSRVPHDMELLFDQFIKCLRE